MKHLKKYNESKSTVVDPTMDVYDLKKLIESDGEDFEDLYDNIISEINSLVQNNPTQTTDFDVYEIYRIWEDDSSNETEEIVAFYNAISPIHAKIRFILNDKSGDYTDILDILDYGYLHARLLDDYRKAEIIRSETWRLEHTKMVLQNIENPI
jgi:hypothetical protein